MVNIVPVDRERHGRKRWRRPNGFEFAANLAVAPLGGSEFSQAIATFPIGFIERSPGSYMPVAVLALSKGGNLFVGPGGQWLGGYIPIVLRSYPFSLIRTDGVEEGALGIDEDSGLVVDNGEGDSLEEFFAADGTLAPTTKAIGELLHFAERDQVATTRAVSVLADAGLINPWPLTMQVGDRQISVNGLHSVNEAALNALDDATFLKLRKASSLVIAYAQLLSMVQVHGLARLSLMQQQMEAVV
jgi:SapC